MRRGIYLGPAIRRGERALRGFVAILAIALVAHGAWLLWARTTLQAARQRVATAGESARMEASRSWSDEQWRALALARSVTSSGVTAMPAPTQLMRLVQELLPAEVRLVSMTFEPAGSVPTMTLEAVASDDRAVSELERRIAGSASVDRNRMLEERRAPDGSVSLRVQIDYAP